MKRYSYETHDQLRAHLRDFVDAYNFARRLKTLRGLTPYEFICKAWTYSRKIHNQSAPENAGTKHLADDMPLKLWQRVSQDTVSEAFAQCNSDKTPIAGECVWWTVPDCCSTPGYSLIEST